MDMVVNSKLTYIIVYIFFHICMCISYDQKGPAHLKILLHYWGKQRAYWRKCPSSYIVKKYPG
jgi:hypothetical protein